jgi:hypothetical protein
MVHNGIEYGMMVPGEVSILRRPYGQSVDPADAQHISGIGSVVRFLVVELAEAFAGPGLESIQGYVEDSGRVAGYQRAIDTGVPAPVLCPLFQRFRSRLGTALATRFWPLRSSSAAAVLPGEDKRADTAGAGEVNLLRQNNTGPTVTPRLVPLRAVSLPVKGRGHAKALSNHSCQKW